MQDSCNSYAKRLYVQNIYHFISCGIISTNNLFLVEPVVDTPTVCALLKSDRLGVSEKYEERNVGKINSNL